MKYGLDDQTIQRIFSTLRQFPEIKTVVIYGSRAKGNFRPGSDIDLVVQNSELSFERLHQLKSALDELPVPYQFDLSIYESLQSLELKDHIDRLGLIFYQQGAS